MATGAWFLHPPNGAVRVGHLCCREFAVWLCADAKRPIPSADAYIFR